MVIIFITAVVFIVIGFFLGRASIKLTYGGKIYTQVEYDKEDGIERKRYTLEVAGDIDKLDKRKSVIFEIVPPQRSLFDS